MGEPHDFNGSTLQIGLLLGRLQASTERLIDSHDRQTELLEDLHVTLVEMPNVLSTTVHQAVELHSLRKGSGGETSMLKRLEFKDLLEAVKLCTPAAAVALAAFSKGTWPDKLDVIRHALASFLPAFGGGH